MPTCSHRRLAVLLALLLATAGCADVLTGAGSLEFEADPASVSESAVTESGYQLETSRPVIINRTVEFQGEERQLDITNHVAVYDKDVQGVDGAFFVAFSTPEAEIAGVALNPLGRLEKERLLERVADQRAEVREVERTGAFETEILDDTRTADTFSAVAEIDGQEVDVVLHITRVSHESDIVVAVGGYPESFEGQDEVAGLMRGIKHPVE